MSAFQDFRASIERVAFKLGAKTKVGDHIYEAVASQFSDMLKHVVATRIEVSTYELPLFLHWTLAQDHDLEAAAGRAFRLFSTPAEEVEVDAPWRDGTLITIRGANAYLEGGGCALCVASYYDAKPVSRTRTATAQFGVFLTEPGKMVAKASGAGAGRLATTNAKTEPAAKVSLCKLVEGHFGVKLNEPEQPALI